MKLRYVARTGAPGALGPTLAWPIFAAIAATAIEQDDDLSQAVRRSFDAPCFGATMVKEVLKPWFSLRKRNLSNERS